ncbi:MAG: PTS sugar transporter subunit IIA [Sphaerochaetaceae bacterium]|jgi:mannitol/fructose-specific phosphotransferase system IIA component (Ntr-type)|nr:PTS sugar transporter subunit IIA [Sphaerochaetaceae bacterium]MDD3163430.1 PTS sugar transporter subunit IIA [Sphaerochaetaceae bacterium]MDD4007638.1 PTS sugar transporter subunit IIA [Sphaerochaetaceae bacterium]MDD4396584.1 PTS sugar transporter subunit IIA [Sphaerochaetaceae bacterium]
MTLYEAARKDLIIVPMESETKDEALSELVRALCNVKGMKFEPILQAIQKRESLGSTAIGNAVAIPHCKTSEAKGISVVIGIAKHLIPYDSNEVKIFFLVVADEFNASSHVQLLSSIARFCSSSVNRNLLAQAKDAQAVYQTIEN